MGTSASDYIRSYGGFVGNATANIGGTAAAAYFPQGLYANAANQWIYGVINTNSVIADGSNRMRLDPAGSSYFNGGNVGIGTASPGNKLEISGNNNIVVNSYTALG